MCTCAPAWRPSSKISRSARVFGERRPSAGVPNWVGMSARPGVGGQLLDQFLILVVHGDRKPRLGDLGECRLHRAMIDAGKAGRVVFISRQFEGGDAAGGEARNFVDAAVLPDRAVKRHVDMRSAVDPRDLLFEQRGRRDGVGHVVGHVDARGHATGGRAAGRPFDSGPAGVAGGVHVAIDEAGEDEFAAMIDGFGGGRGLALTDGGDRLVTDGEIGVPHQPVGGDDVAEEHAVKGCRQWLAILAEAKRQPYERGTHAPTPGVQ